GGEDIDEDKIQAEIDQYQELLHTIDDLIRDAKRPRPDLERRSMNAYEAMQKRKEKLEKLRTYSAQSASFFSEYTSSQQELNNGIAQVKDCKAWNASTGTFDLKKLDMSWAKPINERWKRSPIYLDKQIEAILNSSDSDAVKTAKIVKAYEDYLYELNKVALNEYNNTRKKYGDEWFSKDPKMKDIIDDIEQRLSNYLIQSGVDIKAVVRNMGNDILKANGTKDGMSPLDYLYFASIVDTGAPLDLKTRAYSEDYDFSIWSRNWTGDMSGDYLGNYLFGYFGQGFLMFDGSVLKLSAGAAQAWSDKDIAKWLKNMKAGNFGDNPNDAQYIEDGIKDYKNQKGIN
ncbi:polymorphic toxin type 44 domain-containing protein, partial [Enterococcus ureilyticus]